MASKIETSLTPEQLQEFFRRCAQLKGTKLRDIQALADEYGIEISLMSARSFRQGAFQEYLDELKAKREMAESVTELAKNGIGLSDAAASVFAEKVFDAALRVDPEEIGSKSANNLSLAIARLKSGDQRARYLEAKISDMAQRLQLLQVDAAAAAVKHAKEIKVIMADSKATGAEKTERVRKLLFGERPADWKPVSDTGGQES